MQGRQALPLAGQIEASKLMVSSRPGPVSPLHLGTRTLANLRQRLGPLLKLVLHRGAHLAQGPTGRKPRCATALGQLPKRFASTDAPSLGHAIEIRRRKALGVHGAGCRRCQGQWIALWPPITRDERAGRRHVGHDARGFLHALQAAVAEPFVLGQRTHRLHVRVDSSGHEVAVSPSPAREIDTMVVVADATDARGALRAWRSAALMRTTGRFERLLGWLTAHGRLWRAARTALFWLVTRRLPVRWHLLERLEPVVPKACSGAPAPIPPGTARRSRFRPGSR